MAPEVGERVRVARGPYAHTGLYDVRSVGPVAALAVSVSTGRAVRLPLDTIDRTEHRTGVEHLADRAPLAVVACGASKLARPAPARDLYTGGYFRAALATAEHLAPGRVLILSARYGLIDPAEVVEPYDLRIDQAGAVTVPELVAQAHALDVHQARNVTVLTGAAYWHRARAVWPVATWPLEGLPGIGAHLRRLAELRRREEAAPLTLF